MKGKKLKILFRTSGGRAVNKQLGLGHIYRCLNLAHYLKSNEIFFLIEDYGGVEKILKHSGFKNILKLKNDISLESDISETVNQIQKNYIDIVIVDKYGTKKSYFKQIREYAKVVIITDLNQIDYQADLVVNGFIGFKNKIIKNKYGTRCLLGPSFQILNKKFSKAKNTHKKKYALLATFGGFDEKCIVEILLKSLAKHLQKIKAKIILGPSTIKSKRIRELEKKYRKYLEVANLTNDMYKEISNTKFGICSGGITTYEFAAMKVPFAIICQVKHQLSTAREWQNRGVALNFGLINNKTQKKIDVFLNNIEEKMNHYTLNRKSLVDGLGAQRIVNEISLMK